MPILILTEESNTWTVSAQGSEVTTIYGTKAADSLIVQSGASANLLAFGADDTLQLQGVSVDYSIYRAGATVYLRHTSGNIVTLAVGLDPISIAFDDYSTTLLITPDQGILSGSQLISEKAEPIQQEASEPVPFQVVTQYLRENRDIGDYKSSAFTLNTDNYQRFVIDGDIDNGWFSRDDDYYRFTAAFDGNLTVTLSGQSTDLDLSLMTAHQQLGRADHYGTEIESLRLPIAAGETYYVSVEAAFFSSDSDYVLDLLLTDTSQSLVYWGVRDLALDGWASIANSFANHHFLLIEPGDLSDPDLPPLVDFDDDGTLDGFTIGANKDLSHGTLVPKFNDVTTVSSIRYGTGDPEFHLIKPPEDTNYNQLIDSLLVQYSAYIVNTETNPVDYHLNPYLTGDGDAGNCATWVNTMLDLAGIDQNSRSAISDFNGVDWGENSHIDAEYFDVSTESLVGINTVLQDYGLA